AICVRRSLSALRQRLPPAPPPIRLEAARRLRKSANASSFWKRVSTSRGWCSNAPSKSRPTIFGRIGRERGHPISVSVLGRHVSLEAHQHGHRKRDDRRCRGLLSGGSLRLDDRTQGLGSHAAAGRAQYLTSARYFRGGQSSGNILHAGLGCPTTPCSDAAHRGR